MDLFPPSLLLPLLHFYRQAMPISGLKPVKSQHLQSSSELPLLTLLEEQLCLERQWAHLVIFIHIHIFGILKHLTGENIHSLSTTTNTRKPLSNILDNTLAKFLPSRYSSWYVKSVIFITAISLQLYQASPNMAH